MALHADQPEPARQRPAPAVLDRVAEAPDAGGFAEHAMVDPLAARLQKLDQPHRAVYRRAFLVAGEQEGEGAFERAASGES